MPHILVKLKESDVTTSHDVLPVCTISATDHIVANQRLSSF